MLALNEFLYSEKTYADFNIGIVVDTLPMLQVTLPFTFVNITVGIRVDTLALSLALVEGALVRGTVGVVEKTLAFSLVGHVFTRVTSMLSLPAVISLPITLTVLILTFVRVAVGEEIGALTVALELVVTLSLVHLQSSLES